MKKRAHKKHDFVCIVTKKGKLVCRRTINELKPLTRTQQKCAEKYIAQEMRSFKAGSKRVQSHAQAIAIGLSRARKAC